jgi:PAS domain S-box-containing protein
MIKEITKTYPIYVLCLEDDLKDAELFQELLHDSGFLVKMDIVSNEEQFISSLQASNYDIILADYSLPGFDAPAALKLTIMLRPEVPFICVSGTIGEDMAVELLKQGATDYVLKDRIGRLAFAVQRAIEESETKKDWKKAQAELQEKEDEIKENELRYRYMFDNNPQPMWIYDLDTLEFLEVNHAAVVHYGYSREEFLSMTLKDIRPKEDIDALLKEIELTRKAYNSAGEWRHVKKNGELMCVEVVSYSIFLGEIEARHVMVTDITNRKLAEEKVRESEERFRVAQEMAPDGFTILHPTRNQKGEIIDFTWVYENQTIASINGTDPQAVIGKRLLDLFPNHLGTSVFETYLHVANTGNPQIIEEVYVGDVISIPTWLRLVVVSMGEYIAILSQDITERKKAEEALRLSENHSAFLAQTAFELVELTSIQEIYKYTVQKLYDLFEGNSIVALVEFNYSENHWKMQQIKGVGNKADKLSQLLGFDVNSMEGDISTKYYEQIASGKVKELEFDFPNLFNNKLSAAIGSAVKKMFSIENLYCIVFQQDEQIMGNISFTTNKKSRPINTKLIETFIQQVSNFAKKQKAEDELIKLSRAVEQSPVSIIITDINGKIEYVNAKALALTGYEFEELKGKNPRIFSSGKKSKKEYKVLWETILSGKEWRGEMHNKKKNGELYWEFASISAIKNKMGQITHFLAVKEDITERKQAERDLRELEIARKTARFKQNFLANMSHEIRTPLTGVLGMIDILELTQLTDDQQDYVNTIKTSGENLKEIINLVLDYSKIEAGKLIINPVDFEFQSILQNAVMLYRNITRPGVKVHTQLDPAIPRFIKTDKIRLSQVINNLVSNAVKFTHEGSVSVQARLLATISEEQQVTIEVKVVDTGIGIPVHLQEKLFSPFSQIDDNDTRHYEGTGLGLSISKELVGLLGGEIGLESDSNKGSTFWFTFTAQIAEYQQEKELLHHKYTNHQNLHILLTEDKVVNQKVISLMLKALGHTVTIANNGAQAIELYESGKFDLILMDIQMPVMNGITATQILKERFTDLPPVICLSANAFEGDREKYMDLGMDEYLAKPVKKDDFQKMLQHFVVSDKEPERG